MTELTNNIRKLVSQLGDAKHRRATGLFKAEGSKCVLDTFAHFKVEYILATSDWIEQHHESIPNQPVIAVSRRDLERMSSLSTAPQVIGVYYIPSMVLDLGKIQGSLTIALDCVQDPGNLGTIVRTADWFGVTDILCSRDCVDIYNSKTVQSTMGAISRVRVHYCDLPQILKELRDKGSKIYGTFLEGESIYRSKLSQSGVLLMGNEGKGVSRQCAETVTERLFIPPYPEGVETSESLNVAMATGIILSEFRRQILTK